MSEAAEFTEDAMNEVLRETSKEHGYCLCIHPMMNLMNFSGLTCSWCGQPMTDEAYSEQSKTIRTQALLAAHPEWRRTDDSGDD